MDTDGPAPGENLGTELSDAIVGFHEATGRLLGVSAADHKALGVIQREGPLSASELAARTSVTPGRSPGSSIASRPQGSPTGSAIPQTGVASSSPQVLPPIPE